MPLTVLIVDDEPAILLAIADYLEDVGYAVVTAGNGKTAWELMQQYRPHLLVTDVTMPQLDGYELVRRMRKQPTFRLTPVILLTARTETQERIRGYQTGCDVYLPKPFELEELEAVVRSLLDRTQMVQAELQTRLQFQPELTDAEADLMPNIPDLTQREQEVLELLVDGLSNVQIGDRLHLSPRTIEKYVSSLLQKTDSSNRAEIVRFALERNLIGMKMNSLATSKRPLRHESAHLASPDRHPEANRLRR
ncbi:response regulator [Synechococcales cyanobacterium C]|uniref:Response regulator n=1 Tax=Petrachloros mirabilis ULC683 TaxID=2781853 RepID=A0A8K2AGS9_9CYAN|nr:response regulator transcription factor [Petrachloros mirabilis]NCJ05235.1 response regulator [Petrachloros mirabilis ULC683]